MNGQQACLAIRLRLHHECQAFREQERGSRVSEIRPRRCRFRRKCPLRHLRVTMGMRRAVAQRDLRDNLPLEGINFQEHTESDLQKPMRGTSHPSRYCRTHPAQRRIMPIKSVWLVCRSAGASQTLQRCFLEVGLRFRAVACGFADLGP